MPEFKIEKECKITATIVLNDISEEAYDDIARYIRNRVGGTVEPVKDVACDTAAVETRRTVRPCRMSGDKLEELDKLVGDWKKNPGNYELHEMTVKEFIFRYLCGSDVHPVAVGRRLHKLGVPFNKVSGKTSNGKPSMVMYYQIPVPKETVGTILKKEREAAKLNISEMAELIGYPVAVVRTWENGSGTPSPEAIGLLEKVFGNGCFDKVWHLS